MPPFAKNHHFRGSHVLTKSDGNFWGFTQQKTKPLVLLDSPVKGLLATIFYNDYS
mgnify:CR=1 FL=1